MSMWNIIPWVIATVLAFYNSLTNEQNGIWVLITLLFAANAIRAFVIYFKERKEKNHG